VVPFRDGSRGDDKHMSPQSERDGAERTFLGHLLSAGAARGPDVALEGGLQHCRHPFMDATEER